MRKWGIRLSAVLLLLAFALPAHAQLSSCPDIFGPNELGPNFLPDLNTVLCGGGIISNDVTPATIVISGATTLTLPAAGHSDQLLTFSATATVTIPQGQWAGQHLNIWVCQNGTGGFTATLTPIAGLTIVGTIPSFTTTANKCGDIGFAFISTTTAHVSGSDSQL